MENYQLEKTVFESPVFLCGYPKSGTTLLVSLLDGHNDLVVIPEESKFFSRVVNRTRDEQFDALFQDTNIVALKRDVVDEPSGYRDYSDIDFDLLRSSAYEYWNSSLKTPQYILESLVYGLSKSSGKDNFLHWVEKTPRNELYLDQISSWWPKALAVFLIRDPRQTYCSHREYQLKIPNSSKNSVDVDTFTLKWSESVSAFQHYMENGGNGLIIRYEDLTNTPEKVMRELSNFLYISFSTNLLNPTRNNVQWSGNSSENGVFSGIKKQRLNYYDKLSKSEIAKIEISLEKLMKEFDYDCNNRYTIIERLLYKIQLFTNTKVRFFVGRLFRQFKSLIIYK